MPFSTLKKITNENNYYRLNFTTYDLDTKEANEEFEVYLRTQLANLHEFDPDDDSAIYISSTMLNYLQTNKILHTFAASMGTNPNMSGRIYYKGSITKPIENVMYDMNDFMLHESAPGDYDDWKQAFNKCVVVQLAANKWITNNQVNFNTFTVNKTTYGGVSMYVPQQRPGSSYDKYNSDIKKTSWYQAIQAKDFNW